MNSEPTGRTGEIFRIWSAVLVQMNVYGIFIVDVDVLTDGGFQLLHTAKYA